MHIRPFTPTDQDAARALILEGLREHWGWLDPSLNPDLDDIAASYIAPGHVFLLAESERALVGTGALIIAGDSGQIVRVSVSPRWRRHGIGRALVIALLDAARVRGLIRVWMETNNDWHDAIGLYRRCGFQEYDRREGCVFMALDLARNQVLPGA
jgi:ribosomal protein S18 acetylase RimI-like enzyme